MPNHPCRPKIATSDPKRPLEASARLPDGCSLILRSYVIGPKAPNRNAAKFDRFLALDCAGVEGMGAHSKERKGQNFAIGQPWASEPLKGRKDGFKIQLSLRLATAKTATNTAITAPSRAECGN